MFVLALGAGLLFVIPRQPSENPTLKTAQERIEPAEFATLREAANKQWMGGNYEEAARIFESGYRKALARRETVSAVRFLNNLASSSFAMAQYQKAIGEYLEARRLARSIHYAEMLGTISANLAGLYIQMGDAVAAAEAAESGVRELEPFPNLPYRARLEVQLGNALAWSGRLEPGLAALEKGRREADRTDDVPMLALASDYEGIHRIRHGEISGAETAFLRAYLVRRLRKPDELHLSHANLGRLRLAQRDFAAAENLFSLALAKAHSVTSLIQLWALHHGRGVAREALGRLEEAMADYGAAVELARRWRADAVAADALRMRTDVGLHRIHHSYILLGNRLALDRGDTEMARRTFAVQEEARAASLRERWRTSPDWRRRLPEEYDRVLSQLQSAEVAVFRNPTPQDSENARQLRLALIEMEAAAGVPQPPAVSGTQAELSHAIQRKLSPSQALFSFDLGEEDSFLWAVTRDGFSLHRIAPKQSLAVMVSQFREAVRSGKPEAVVTGSRLYSALFNAAPDAALRKREWILALDDTLFEAPLAAAVVGSRNGRPVYVAERHSLLVVPSAAALLEPGSESRAEGRDLFVGLGDPVYNTADPRWAPAEGKSRQWPWVHNLFGALRNGPKPQGEIQLPRLAASAAEIRECSRQWGGSEPVLLEGPDASRERLATALRKNPAVLHLAAHVLSSPARPESAVIALGLVPPGRTDVVTDFEIPSLGAARLVVMSGCHSGAGLPLPGAGLTGLTRAWLAAGAERVVSSLWPTPDDFGEIFLSFYRHISLDPKRASEALRQAQIEMLESRSWRSEPRYWAAYVVTGKG